MNVYALGLLVSILAYLVVGNYAGRKVKHLEDYFVAGRQAPTLLIFYVMPYQQAIDENALNLARGFGR